MDDIYNEDGYLVVKEDHLCEHWEPDDGALVPMRECWCCKWAEFVIDNRSLTSESLGSCCYHGNMSRNRALKLNCGE